MKQKILIAEDDVQTRSFIRDTVLKVNAKAFVAEYGDGFAALLSLSQDKFNLLIMDLRMPCTTGQELFEALRNISPEHRPDHVLIVSGFIEEKFKDETPFEVTYLEKPFKMKELEDYLRKVLA